MSIWTHTTVGAWAKVAVLPLMAAGLLVMAGCDVEQPADPVTPEVPTRPTPPEPEVSSSDEAAATLVSLRKVEEGEELKPYPLDVCIVSNENLESMGGPIVRAWKDQEVKFCCEGCLEEFEAKPDEYLAKMTAAASDLGAEAVSVTEPHDHSDHDHAH